MLGRRHMAALLPGVLLLVAACGSPPPRQPNPTRPLAESRAVQVIISAFHEQNAQPIPGRKVELPDGTPLQIDVGSQGKKFGVAYITAAERGELGQALGPRDPSKGDALQLARGRGVDADARILILYDEDYLYDDHIGTEHEETTITAERKLSRDVRDFLVQAKAQRWP